MNWPENIYTDFPTTILIGWKCEFNILVELFFLFIYLLIHFYTIYFIYFILFVSITSSIIIIIIIIIDERKTFFDLSHTINTTSYTTVHPSVCPVLF